jgi:hypothetical protein
LLTKCLVGVVCGLSACDSNGFNPGNGSSEFIRDIFPKDLTGTWLELGPDIAVLVDFQADRAVAFGELTRFVLDGQDRTDDARVIPSQGADPTTVTLVLSIEEMASGAHEALVEFRDSRDDRHGAEWDFEVVEEADVGYVLPAEVADYIRSVTPPDGAVGTWEVLGPLIEVSFASPDGAGSFLAFQLDGVDGLDGTSGVLLEQSGSIHLELSALAAGVHEVKISFLRPPERDVVHRVAWSFTVVE